MNRFIIFIIILIFLMVFKENSIIICESSEIQHHYPLSSQQQLQLQLLQLKQHQQHQNHNHNSPHHRVRHQSHHQYQHRQHQHQQQYHHHHNHNHNHNVKTNANNNLNSNNNNSDNNNSNNKFIENLWKTFNLNKNSNINELLLQNLYLNNDNIDKNKNHETNLEDTYDINNNHQQHNRHINNHNINENYYDDIDDNGDILKSSELMNNLNTNSMEIIGFDDDPMKNLNSEYSINIDSKDYLTNQNNNHNNNNNNNDQNQNHKFILNANKINHNNMNNNKIFHNLNHNHNRDDINNNSEEEINGDISDNHSYSNNNINSDNDNISNSSSNSSSSSSNSSSSSSSSIKCPKCSGQTNNVRVSEEELIELRIEFVKNQILQKLRLKEKPKVFNTNGLPKLIYDGTQIGIQNDENKLAKDLDDYYARTSQKFIFLEQEKKECYRTNHQQHPSVCFSFKIDGDVDGIDVNTAELWVYKRHNLKDKMKQTFVVSEVYQGMNSKYLPKAKPIAIQSTGVEEGWIKFDIAWPIRKWFGNHDLNHIIEISCQSCELEDTIIQHNQQQYQQQHHNQYDNTDNRKYYENNNHNYDLISIEKDYTPFIVIDTMNRRQRRRQKRNVNCTAGVTECCREKLYISFEEIGWDDWIIQPSGYNAYFCRGSCSSAASITMSNTHHSSFLRKVLYQRESNGKKPLELIPCCTAKQFSSLQLFYRDSNNTATLKTLPNMVVESCGCM